VSHQVGTIPNNLYHVNISAFSVHLMENRKKLIDHRGFHLFCKKSDGENAINKIEQIIQKNTKLLPNHVCGPHAEFYTKYFDRTPAGEYEMKPVQKHHPGNY
jgi:hypothetical protein